MKKPKKMVPEVRFKGFVDDWEQRKVGDLGTVVTGSTPPTNDQRNYGGKYLFISPVDIQGSRYVENTVTTLSEKGFRMSRILKEGSILFVSIGSTIGKVAQTKALSTTNQQINAIEVNDIADQDFVFSLMEKKAKTIKKLAATQAVPIVNKTVFSNVDISIPEDPREKFQIGKFFTNLDNLITLHQRKLDALAQLKKGFMQVVFPMAGENRPRLRFANFKDIWQQRKFGETGEFNPKSVLPEKFKYVDLESVIGTELIGCREENKATAPSRAQRLARQGDLFYQTVRPYQKNNYLFDKPCDNYVFSTGYAQIRPFGDGYFLLSLVQNDLFVKSVLDRCTGTSYPAINSNDLADIDVYIPFKKEEQVKISAFFKNIDNLITLHQNKLEKLQSLKKAYLQKMFI